MQDLDYIEENHKNFDEVMKISGYIRPKIAKFKFQTFANKLEVTNCIAKDIIDRGGRVIVICESMKSIIQLKRDENIKEKAIRVRVIASEEDFKQPHFAMAADHVTVVLAKFA